MTKLDELQDGQFHPDNPVFSHKSQAKCNDCGGNHEPSGAWRDCLNYWKNIAEQSLRQKNQIAVALAYLEADQPNLAKLVLEGMEP